MVQSNDNADSIEEDMRFKFVDDLSILELVMFSSLVNEYDFLNHIPNDLGVDESYVPPESLMTQKHLDSIAEWSKKNKMAINESKTKYMVFSRSNKEMATRLAVNGKTIERIEETKLVGVWLSTWLDWEKNTKEVCKKAFSRMPLISKLKYVGVPLCDLIQIYTLYIRCILEYCSVVWHSTLTVQQAHDIERVQRVALKIILGENYGSYENALRLTGLEKLSDRREAKCLEFGLKSLLHPLHSRKFPLNKSTSYNTRNPEHFKVNWANSESYRKSAIPYIQRKLNEYVRNFSNNP